MSGGIVSWLLGGALAWGPMLLFGVQRIQVLWASARPLASRSEPPGISLPGSPRPEASGKRGEGGYGAGTGAPFWGGPVFKKRD